MEYLPSEIIAYIFDFLPVDIQIGLLRVCWQWHDILKGQKEMSWLITHMNMCKKYPQISQFAIERHKQEFKHEVDALLQDIVHNNMIYYNIAGARGSKSLTITFYKEKMTILNDLGNVMIKTWKISSMGGQSLMDKIKYSSGSIGLHPALAAKDRMELIVNRLSNTSLFK